MRDLQVIAIEDKSIKLLFLTEKQLERNGMKLILGDKEGGNDLEVKRNTL
jgi:CRISPR/Cas system-associated protein endoribonuclease Cas2